jgi:hypothetical protein
MYLQCYNLLQANCQQANRPTLDQVQHVLGRLWGLPLHPGKLLRVLLQQAQAVLQQRQGSPIAQLLRQGGVGIRRPAQGWRCCCSLAGPWQVFQRRLDAFFNAAHVDAATQAVDGRQSIRQGGPQPLSHFHSKTRSRADSGQGLLPLARILVLKLQLPQLYSQLLGMLLQAAYVLGGVADLPASSGRGHGALLAVRMPQQRWRIYLQANACTACAVYVAMV